MAIEGEHRAVVPVPMADLISVVTRRDSAWRSLLRTLYAQPASAFGTTMVPLLAITFIGDCRALAAWAHPWEFHSLT